MPFFKNHNLLFIHIPKTGGSNIENFLFTVLKEKPNLSHLLSNNLEIRVNNHSLQHMTYMELYQNREYFDINFDKIKIITVVRNPYDRIMSDLFFYKIALKDNNSDEIEEIIKKYLNNHSLYDNHKLPQYKFLISNEITKVINPNIIILKSENLNQDMENLGFKEFKNFCSCSNKTEINKDYSKYLNTNSIKMINQYYRLDFYYFKYNMI